MLTPFPPLANAKSMETRSGETKFLTYGVRFWEILREQPGPPPLKGGIPVVLLMGESSDNTDIALFSIEDSSATTRWILDLSSLK